MTSDVERGRQGFLRTTIIIHVIFFTAFAVAFTWFFPKSASDSYFIWVLKVFVVNVLGYYFFGSFISLVNFDESYKRCVAIMIQRKLQEEEENSGGQS